MLASMSVLLWNVAADMSWLLLEILLNITKNTTVWIQEEEMHAK